MLGKFFKFGSYGQCVASFIVSFGSFSSGVMLGWYDAVIPRLLEGSAGFTLTEPQITLMLVSSSIGAFVTPIPAGVVIDRIGRRNSMLVFLIGVNAGWIVIYHTETPFLVYFSSFLFGVWGSFDFCTVGVYICEITEPKIRGKWSSFSETLYFLGILYSSLVSHKGYHSICLACALPSVILVLGLIMIPESPYFYLLKGDRKAASETLKLLRGVANKIDLDSMEEAVMDQSNNKNSYSDIFTSPVNLRAFLLAQFFCFADGNSSLTLLNTFATTLLPNSWILPQTGFTILCCSWVVSSLIGCFVIELVDRRRLLLISSVVAALALTCTSSWYYLRDNIGVNVASTGWVPLVTLMISSSFETCGIHGVQGVLLGEIFDHSIKTKALALTSMMLFFLDGINMLFFYDLTKSIGMYYSFIKSVISSISCIIFSKYFMVETRGRTLEELQYFLRNENHLVKIYH